MSEPGRQNLSDDENRGKSNAGEWRDFTEVKAFNLLVKTNLGDFTTGDDDRPVYLPGEACQGIYLNFQNVVYYSPHEGAVWDCSDWQKPFATRIGPRNFLFRAHLI